MEGEVLLRTVCFYSVATHLGGAERSLLDLVRALRARPELGYEPWVLAPKPEGPLVDALRSHGIGVEALPMPPAFLAMSRQAPLESFQNGIVSIPGMALYLRGLGRKLAERAPALIHTTGVKCHALGAALGPVAGIPVLWHLRDIFKNGPTLWTLRALRRAAGSGLTVVANSRATAEAFASADSSIRVIHNGLDPAVYFPDRNVGWHERLGIPDGTPVVGIVGVLARWKGQSQFLKMAERLVRQGASARFVIVGDEIYDTQGEDRGYGKVLREEAAALGISDRVLFSGFEHDVSRAINGLDVLVHASVRPEPFGRVILEAMACGVPVVASGAGGVLEFVENERTGLLFGPGNVGEMAAAVSRLIENPRLREQCAEAALSRFLARMTHETHCGAVVSVYDSIVSAYKAR